jgi:hypothetical protein
VGIVAVCHPAQSTVQLIRVQHIVGNAGVVESREGTLAVVASSLTIVFVTVALLPPVAHPARSKVREATRLPAG